MEIAAQAVHAHNELKSAGNQERQRKIERCGGTSGNRNADLQEIMLDFMRKTAHKSTNAKVHHGNTFKLKYFATCGWPSQLFTASTNAKQKSTTETPSN